MWLWREKKSLLDERVMDELTLEAQSSSSSPFRYLLLVQLTLWPFLIASLARSATACTATSTTPTPDCATCTADQLTLTQGDGTTSTTPTASAIITDGNGCFHIMVTCTAVNGGMTFMQFNVNQGGPINPTGTVVTATLDCVGGQWIYQQGGISRVITEVNCQNT